MGRTSENNQTILDKLHNVPLAIQDLLNDIYPENIMLYRNDK